jgi:hypothetical protein
MGFAHEIRDERMHTRGCEKYGRIIFGDKGFSGNLGMALTFEKLDVF